MGCRPRSPTRARGGAGLDPFRFNPIEQVRRSMAIWDGEDFNLLNGHEADRVICLQFPAYYVKHPRKCCGCCINSVSSTICGTRPSRPSERETDVHELRNEIIERDSEALSQNSPALCELA
jgi:hypothetical protein